MQSVRGALGLSHRLQDVFIMQNPDKLARVGGPAIHQAVRQ